MDRRIQFVAFIGGTGTKRGEALANKMKNSLLFGLLGLDRKVCDSLEGTPLWNAWRTTPQHMLPSKLPFRSASDARLRPHELVLTSEADARDPLRPPWTSWPFYVNWLRTVTSLLTTTTTNAAGAHQEIGVKHRRQTSRQMGISDERSHLSGGRCCVLDSVARSCMPLYILALCKAVNTFYNIFMCLATSS